MIHRYRSTPPRRLRLVRGPCLATRNAETLFGQRSVRCVWAAGHDGEHMSQPFIPDRGLLPTMLLWTSKGGPR